MKVIYKYRIELADRITKLYLKAGAEIVEVNSQTGDVFIWVLMPEKAKKMEAREFEIYGTGHEIPDNRIYIGSTVTMDNFVWHVFEVTK